MKPRGLVLLPIVAVARALRVRLSVGPRRRYWANQATSGDFYFVALGDSLTQGIGSTRPATSWLGLFRHELSSRTGRTIRVDNRAVYGARIADVLATQLSGGLTADLVTVCIGSNDAGRTAPAQFEASFRWLCDRLPDGSVVGDVPEFQWGPRVDAAAELSAIVRAVVAEHPELVLAEVERHTAGLSILTELAGDFFHPSNKGYRRIAAAFVEALDSRCAIGQSGQPARPAR